MEGTEPWGLVQCCKDSTQPCSVVQVHVSLDSWYWQLHMLEDLTSVWESRMFFVKKIDSNGFSCSPPLKRAKKQGQMPYCGAVWESDRIPPPPWQMHVDCDVQWDVNEVHACMPITILAVTEYRHYTVLSTRTPWMRDHMTPLIGSWNPQWSLMGDHTSELCWSTVSAIHTNSASQCCMPQWNVDILAHSDHLGGTAEQLQLVASWRTDMLPHRYYVTKLACSSVIFMWQPHS